MCALYIRVSRIDLNPENQRIALESFAQQKGWKYEIFEEKETSRKTRPIKEALMARIRKRDFEGVVVWKLDRWARSSIELNMNMDELISRGIQFISVTQPIDTTTSTGRLQIQILAAFAEFEREIIRERTIAGLERARQKGIKLGRPKKAA